ncbi:MAG TPA: hypothetical protein VGA32_02785 [Anaerolineales bacterium]
MEIGMLWFDEGPGSVKEKVARAAEFYAAKYGEKPTVCLLHPDTLGSLEGRVGGIQLLAQRSILPNHFWIGVEEAPAEAEPSGNGKSKKARPTIRRRGGRPAKPAPAKSELRAAA